MRTLDPRGANYDFHAYENLFSLVRIRKFPGRVSNFSGANFDSKRPELRFLERRILVSGRMNLVFRGANFSFYSCEFRLLYCGTEF